MAEMRGWRRAAGVAILALGLAAAAAQAAPVQAPPSPTLAQVVARYIAWRGGEAFRNETDDYHESAELKLYGVAGTLETWHTPDHWRTELHAPGMSAVSVVTARGSWSTTINGQLVETPEAYRYAKREPQSAKAMEGKAGDTVSLLGEAQLDGRAWQVVRVTYDDADTYDSFIDPVTGELGAARVTEKGQLTFEHFGDWRWVKGAREPFMSREVSPAGDEKIGTVTRLDVDVAIDPALFARPKPGQQLIYAGGRDATDWIPFTGLDEGRIFVPLTVNGRAVTAILDSGAGTALLDSSFAANAGLKPVGAVPLSGENAVGAGALISGVEIGLGGATLKGVTVTTTDLRSLGVVQPVLMGEDIFRGAVVDIDFPGRRLALRDPARFRPPAGAIAVTLVHDGADQLVPVSVEGGPPAPFIMDTGFPMALRIAPHLAKAQNLLAGKPSAAVSAGGIGGSAPAQIASLRRLSLGGVGFSNVPVMFSDAWPSATYTDRVQGLLGIGLLSRFRVIVDWPDGRLYLIPAPGAAAAPFARDRLGVIWAADGQALRIAAVQPGSPAERAGLKAGETIETINGKPAASAGNVGNWPQGAQVTLVARAPAGTTTLTLADYY
jgi:hypothetical protein